MTSSAMGGGGGGGGRRGRPSYTAMVVAIYEDMTEMVYV